MTTQAPIAADEAISAQALLQMALKRIHRAESERDPARASDQLRSARCLLALAKEKIDRLADVLDFSDLSRAAHA